MATTRALDTGAIDGFERGGWREAHAALSRLARARAGADAEEGRWLLAARRAEAHRHLGYGGFSEYVERLLGYSPRTTLDKLRVAEALETLPGLQNALAAGQLNWCAVRELTRVAQPGTEQAWLGAARGKTVRELGELVSGKAPGAHPSEPSQPALRRHVLRFELSAETYALFRDAIAQVKRQGGGTLSDDDALLTLARQALGGPSDAGRSSYQIAIDLCARCGRAEQHSNGKAIEVSPEVAALACCDGQHVGGEPSAESPVTIDVACCHGHVDGELAMPANENAIPMGHEHPDLPSAISGTPKRGSGATPAPVAVEPRPSARPTVAHAGTRHILPRASQTIPPSVRRAVLRRDHNCCRVPGCNHTQFVELHHLHPRAEGGPNTPENLIPLCGAHHRAVHRGELIISGTEPELRFHHADGTPYGELPDAVRADAHAKVFSALRQLGFRERDARAVLSELAADASLLHGSVNELLRQALMRIRPCAR